MFQKNLLHQSFKAEYGSRFIKKLVLLGSQEYDFDLLSGFAGRSLAVGCFMTSNLCTPIKNTWGQSAVVCHACESILLCEV